MRPVIALDADGVLLNYHEAYADAWAKAFGVRPELRDPGAYWPVGRWNVRWLDGDELTRFRTCFDDSFWSTIPALPGAVDACEALVNAGYDLVCVTAMEPQYQPSRLRNLQSHGFPIARVIATSGSTAGASPKAAVLSEIAPVAFVDDYLPYVRGIHPAIHAALVLRERNGSPNVGEDLALVHSQHENLPDFVNWWLNER